MKVTVKQFSLTVERERADPKVRGGSWGRADTALFGKITKALQAQGLDVIRRRLSADGHMMGDDTTCYIRDRKWKFAFVDEQWAVRTVGGGRPESGGEVLAMAKLIQPDGTETDVTPKAGPTFTLEELQAFVGGFIEIVWLDAGPMVINEEGKLHRLPQNPKATALAHGTIFDTDFIVGPALLTAPGEME